jgi:hypothetical protein
VLAQTLIGDLTFLVTDFGKPLPRTASEIGSASAAMRRVPHCTAHGLRKAGDTIAAENGATDRQLMALMIGHQPNKRTFIRPRPIKSGSRAKRPKYLASGPATSPLAGQMRCANGCEADQRRDHVRTALRKRWEICYSARSDARRDLVYLLGGRAGF